MMMLCVVVLALVVAVSSLEDEATALLQTHNVMRMIRTGADSAQESTRQTSHAAPPNAGFTITVDLSTATSINFDDEATAQDKLFKTSQAAIYQTHYSFGASCWPVQAVTGSAQFEYPCTRPSSDFGKISRFNG
jgi:hypothetical protein